MCRGESGRTVRSAGLGLPTGTRNGPPRKAEAGKPTGLGLLIGTRNGPPRKAGAGKGVTQARGRGETRAAWQPKTQPCPNKKRRRMKAYRLASPKPDPAQTKSAGEWKHTVWPTQNSTLPEQKAPVSRRFLFIQFYDGAQAALLGLALDPGKEDRPCRPRAENFIPRAAETGF